jgi:NlpC/P60 family
MIVFNHGFRVFLFLFLLVLCVNLCEDRAAAKDPTESVFEVPIDVPVAHTDLLLNFATTIRHTRLDCTHLVHDLYRRFGFDYDYANSTTLYKGIQGFRHVAHPEAGDLIVWRGHAGIIVDPEEHTFVSALRTGVKVASYVSRYWRSRGRPRFFHYVGTSTMIETALIN